MIRRTLLLSLVALTVYAQDFTSEAWKRIAPVYAKTLQHPFLTGLADGKLPRDRFQYYLTQDALYLRMYSQALATLASKAPDERWSLTLTQHSIDAIKAEREMHEKILGSYGITPDTVARAQMAPVNVAYTNHLLASIERLSFTEGLAAMLPCYWIYLEVGRELVKHGSPNKDYQRWIDQYAGDEYAKSVRDVLAMMNESARRASAAERESALRLFERSARYEWMFWDMAWRLEQWPPQP